MEKSAGFDYKQRAKETEFSKQQPKSSAEEILKKVLFKYCPEKEKKYFEEDWADTNNGDNVNVRKAMVESMEEYSNLKSHERVKELEEWNKQLRENLDASIDDYDKAFKRIKGLEEETENFKELYLQGVEIINALLALLEKLKKQ